MVSFSSLKITATVFLNTLFDKSDIWCLSHLSHFGYCFCSLIYEPHFYFSYCLFIFACLFHNFLVEYYILCIIYCSKFWYQFFPLPLSMFCICFYLFMSWFIDLEWSILIMFTFSYSIKSLLLLLKGCSLGCEPSHPWMILGSTGFLRLYLSLISLLTCLPL